ncbi:putative low molecular weight protein-tyrosine-phosphatase slr0328 [Gammaproteobacteria bacterium]
MEKIKILFVCMGNICRSPTAQGVFARLIQEHNLGHRFEIDSAGTHAYHVGEPPDRRSQEAAARRGVDLNALRARHVAPKDFEHYHYLLAMDRDNYHTLRQAAPPKYLHKVRLFLEFAPHLPIDEVPDPYYGGPDGFEQVLDIVDAAARGLLTELQATVLSPSGK